MKYLISVFLFLAVNSWADTQTIANRSSRTISADTLIRVQNSHSGDILFKVLVTSISTVIGASMSIYDSSNAASGLIAKINLSTSSFLNSAVFNPIQTYDFNIRVTSAITYTITNPADVTILWKKDDFNASPQ